eukprot:SAG25_NODE_55_length_18625_cov_548.233726_1_plen_65_part_00
MGPLPTTVTCLLAGRAGWLPAQPAAGLAGSGAAAAAGGLAVTLAAIGRSSLARSMGTPIIKITS